MAPGSAAVSLWRVGWLRQWPVSLPPVSLSPVRRFADSPVLRFPTAPAHRFRVSPMRLCARAPRLLSRSPRFSDSPVPHHPGPPFPVPRAAGSPVLKGGALEATSGDIGWANDQIMSKNR
jgi:hypothetical protein